MKVADDPGSPSMRVDVGSMTVSCGPDQRAVYAVAAAPSHGSRGLDVIGLGLTYREQIDAFAQAHWQRQSWVRDVARRTIERLQGKSTR